MTTIGIIGSRRRDTEDDYHIVENAFFKVYKPGDRICSGGCPKGGDRFAEIIAKKFDIPILLYKAEWKKFGKSAGFIRNSDIASIKCLDSVRGRRQKGRYGRHDQEVS